MVLDQDVALVLVVVKRTVVDHVTRSGPGVRQEMLHEVLTFHEVSQSAVLKHTPPFEVAVHRPHLGNGGGNREMKKKS